MNPQTARLEFEQFLFARLGSPTLPPPAVGFAQLLEYYRSVRADDCALEADGDMLLFQWGTWDWGEGHHDEVSLTRQLIGPSGEDDEIWQLTLSYRFPPQTVLAGTPAGNRWCRGLEDVDAFQSFVTAHPAYLASQAQPGGEASLTYEQAG